MTGTELTRRMTTLELSAEQLAEMLAKHPDEVHSWQRIEGNLPRSVAGEVTWALAVAERGKLMDRSGLPECAWLESHMMQVPTTDVKLLRRHSAELEAHIAECEVCQARETYAAKLPPIPAMPLSGSTAVLAGIAAWVGRLPPWARPAATGALIVGAITIFRAFLFLVIGRARPTPAFFGAVAAAIGAAAYMGAAGGLTYTAVRAPLRRFGRGGDYLTGIVCAYASLFAIALPAALFTKDDMFRTSFGWLLLLVVGTVFGLSIGHFWFRDVETASGGA